MNSNNALPGLMLALGVLMEYPATAQHAVHVTPSTVEWGYYAADAKPVLTVRSGEVVTIDEILDDDPDMLEKFGATQDEVLREMKEIHAKVKDQGPGSHILTGPVAIAGAMPGDVLEVEILEIRLRTPYGWMMIQPESGALPEEFPYLRQKLIHFDLKN